MANLPEAEQEKLWREWFSAWREASKRAGNPFRSEEVQDVLRKHGINEGG